jgi:phosphoribosyl-AMP cyclohydrolase
MEKLKLDPQGLIPVIVQDAENGHLLMVAYQSREAVLETLKTGKVHFYSRSRRKLWVKGEESGHTQELVEARVDCDQDAILYRVKQKVAACHKGYRSCFYRKVRLPSGDLEVVEAKVFDPERAYG